MSLVYNINQIIKEMLSKLFDAREKLNKLDFEDFEKYLKKNQLSKQDYLNLMREIFETKKKRPMFIRYLKLLMIYSNEIIDSTLAQQPLYLALCKFGTVSEVQGVTKIINEKIQKHCHENPLYYALLNDNKHGEREEILKYLLMIKPELVSWNIKKPLISEALSQKKLEAALIFIEKGANCQAINQQQENLLHLLYKAYNKNQEKLILKIRAMLIQRGVSQKKINRAGKKALDYCPQIAKKITDDQKQRKNYQKPAQESSKFKGKSEEGWESVQKSQEEKKQSQINNEGYKDIFLKIDAKNATHELNSEVSAIIDMNKQEKQKEIKKKKMDREREKQKSKKKILTPEQLKYYLEQDILSFTQAIQKENKQRYGIYSGLIQKVKNDLKSKFNIDVQVFGSFATGLCLPQSDIDMVIIPNLDSDTTLEKIHKEFESNIKMYNYIDKISFHEKATVPIIKITCTQEYFGKKLDFTMQNANHNGRKSIQLIKQYLGIYPQLRPLTFILKNFIYKALLSDPYSGGISSYGMVIMIVAYIQYQNRDRKKKGIKERATSAELFIGLLKYYGFTSNYIGKQINVLSPAEGQVELNFEYFDENKEPIYTTLTNLTIFYNDWQLRPKLCINDPLDSENNIGRAAFQINKIKNAFQIGYVCIHINKQCGQKKKCQSYRRIKSNAKIDLKYTDNKRPCCILKRFFQVAVTHLLP